jgi:hypothetical protein
MQCLMINEPSLFLSIVSNKKKLLIWSYNEKSKEIWNVNLTKTINWIIKSLNLVFYLFQTEKKY